MLAYSSATVHYQEQRAVITCRLASTPFHVSLGDSISQWSPGSRGMRYVDTPSGRFPSRLCRITVTIKTNQHTRVPWLLQLPSWKEEMTDLRHKVLLLPRGLC